MMLYHVRFWYGFPGDVRGAFFDRLRALLPGFLRLLGVLQLSVSLTQSNDLLIYYKIRNGLQHAVYIDSDLIGKPCVFCCTVLFRLKIGEPDNLGHRDKFKSFLQVQVLQQRNKFY